MVDLNFTVVVEMVLFLTFLWVTNRFIFQPLLRIMDAREARLKEDKTAASTDAAETERLDAEFIERLTNVDQEVAQNLRDARYEAYQHNRDKLDKLRHEADAEVTAFREKLQAELAEERRQYPNLIAGLVETMEKWATGGGTTR